MRLVVLLVLSLPAVPERESAEPGQPVTAAPSAPLLPSVPSSRPEYQTLPTPGKAAAAGYKPVPPPKPKAYRRGGPGDSPLRAGNPRGGSGGGRDDFAAYSANGADDSAGFDSGHGSSLDRNYEPAGGRGYVGVPSPAGGGGQGYSYLGTSPAAGGGIDPAGLDLATRDQRGSAFELYKKPLEARYSAPPPPTEHGAR